MNFDKIKKTVKYIFADYNEFSLEKRLLISAIIFGSFISLLGAVVSIIISSTATVIFTSFTLSLILVIAYYFVRVKMKFEYFVFPIIIVSIIGISIIWIFDGGINGANLFPGIVILILSLIVVSDNKKKYVISLFIASVIIIYLIQLYRPDLIVGFPSEKVRWIDSIITVIYSSFLIFLIIKLLHKNYTLERQRAEENAAQLQELNATKDKLFSIIAHDLRSPFNNILGFSELLLENKNDNKVAKSEKYLGIINSSANNTLILLDNLLNWAQSQTGKISFNPKKIIFSNIILEIIKLKKSIAKAKNISLNYSSSDEIEVYADENVLKTILRNLISNAIKFTNSNGKIDVTALQNDNFIEIAVSDNGVGMNDETRKKLFDISTNITTKGTANEKGSGLGLILCKEFIEKHGGKIWIESEEGRGSIFKFTLPLNKSYQIKHNS